MDQVSFILLMLLLTLLVMFVKYLCQLYKDRDEVGVMVRSGYKLPAVKIITISGVQPSGGVHNGRLRLAGVLPPRQHREGGLPRPVHGVRDIPEAFRHREPALQQDLQRPAFPPADWG